MSAVGDLMSSMWSSGFTGVPLYIFLDGYHSALSLLPGLHSKWILLLSSGYFEMTFLVW